MTLGRLTVSLINTDRATDEMATIGALAKNAAAQAVPMGKRAGTTAVQGVRQGVQGARDWAAPRLQDAVYDARAWAAPRLEDAADAVDTSVAPKVSSALRTTARQVRPTRAEPGKIGMRRLLDWRLLLGVGALMAAAGTTAAVAMRRRYASATAEAKDATESADEERTQAGESATDTAAGSEVNGRVTTPGR
jgi:hypothetical protein